MALDEDLAERMRGALAGAGAIREVKMFGGLCFMLNGNMVAGTSKRGLLVPGRQRPARPRLGAGGRKTHGNVGPADGRLYLGRPAPT